MKNRHVQERIWCVCYFEFACAIWIVYSFCAFANEFETTNESNEEKKIYYHYWQTKQQNIYEIFAIVVLYIFSLRLKIWIWHLAFIKQPLTERHFNKRIKWISIAQMFRRPVCRLNFLVEEFNRHDSDLDYHF